MNEHLHHDDAAAAAADEIAAAGHLGHPAHSEHDDHGHQAHEAHAHHGGHTGHGGHHGHGDHVAMFRTRFWWTLALTVPIVYFSHMIQDWFGYMAPHFDGADLIAPVLGTIIFLYGGWPFLSGGVDEARQRQPGMMLLIAMAITVAYAASLATSLGLIDLDFWWELAALIAIMLLGHWLEMRAVGQAQGALQALAALLPDEAERVTDSGTEKVGLDELRSGDVVLVRPGGRIPADGEVVDGDAEVDESMVTGESRPVSKTVGNKVVAGTVATDSSLRLRVEATGSDTALAGIQRLVEEAQTSRSRAQALADRAAALLFYYASGAGIITFIVWMALGETNDAVTRTVTVLVIACPHALGLAIPLVIALSTAISAHQGILVKDRLALERMRLVNTVLFDKTGTLTAGRHVVTGVEAVDGDVDSLLAFAGAAESESEHPLARAIVTKSLELGATKRATNFRSLPGRGIEADVDGHDVVIGGPSLLRERSIAVPDQLTAKTAVWSERGAAVLHVVVDGTVAGAIALEDEIRAESKEAVDALHRIGVQVVMITGDARPVADAVAQKLGIDEVFAEVLPEDKDKAVTTLQERGRKVAMVGDGVNDAPALARADVGLAIGAGTDVAIESAGVVLASSDPRAVLGVIKLSRAGYRKMVQNLVWATGYNLLAVPIAAGVLAPVGISLSPAIGAVLMSVSTIVVALNAQLLRRLDLRVGVVG
jgi:Cu2+-exporting ATPase